MEAGTELVVLAIGGNSLIRDEAHRSVPDQWELTRETCRHIAPLVEAGHRVVITHGNGPQVGFILRRSELARHELHPVPLDSCDADTQGAIGYMVQQALGNELRRRGSPKQVVAVVTQVEVDAQSPAFTHPAKPIGSFMDEATARQRQREGWSVGADAGRGWRRLVPSPEPLRVVELDVIRTLVADGFVVIAAGGGGIPVARTAGEGELRGVEAVIDKDLASSLLARGLGADALVISTSVERVCLRYGKPDEQPLDRMTLAEARRYLAEGHFGAGSMAPKIEGIARFLETGGRRAIVTSPENLERAVAGRAGTLVVP